MKLPLVSMVPMLPLVVIAALASCGGKTPAAAPGGGGSGSGSSASLYDRLGRRDAIASVVKDFVELRLAKDNRINALFVRTDLPGFEVKLTDQICQISDGPCTYTGKDMKTAHAGMNITDAQFDALVEDLVASLKQFSVPDAEQKELLGKLAALHDAIVTAK